MTVFPKAGADQVKADQTETNRNKAQATVPASESEVNDTLPPQKLRIPAVGERPAMRLHVFRPARDKAGRQMPMSEGSHTFVAKESSLQSANKKNNGFSFDIETAYRIDDLNWTISGMDGTPNILSELDWRDLYIFQLKTRLNWDDPNSGWRFQSSLAYGWIYDGENRDSDYTENDRNGEFSRSYAKVSDDNVTELALGAGYGFDFADSDSLWLKLTPMFGYAFYQQLTRMTDGILVISEDVPDMDFVAQPLGLFPRLDSTYQARWEGFWLGMNGELMVTNKLSLMASIAWHQVDYAAVANWNLRSEFAHPVSFRHEADGTGLDFSLGFVYRFSADWSFTLSYAQGDWETDSGIDMLYLEGEDEPITTPIFNGARWQTRSLNMGLKYQF